ncbi:DUF559 domain-containing protein [Cellulomonas carbonis]|uniref:DUF559 domain-containing protein n=1 Tax=Cellulomonas carbonis T26 TaxID=947969 RepID=A0A0A0BKX5_9CELL|nr:DUF559 domain-containing protein [Cellulomonas carbonis]KGM08530.1 hypothetical protein N868_04575 [Cellulomonas carbonis T26]
MDLPAELRRRPFTVAEARRLGVTDSTLRARDLCTGLRGVRAADDVPDTTRSLAAAALLVTPEGAVVSHLTALRLHGAEPPWPLDSDHRVHLTVPAARTISARSTLAVHRAGRRPPWVLVDDLPVVTPEMAWLQVAATVGVEMATVIADSLLRRVAPISSSDRLAEALATLPPRTRGRRVATSALALSRPGTDSSMETRARLALVSGGLPCPLVNVPVLDDDGRFVALPDMQYARERIVVEYDGDVHRTDRAVWRRDVERRQRLEELGWVTVTATADDVLRDRDRLVARVARLLRTRSRLSHPSTTR